MRASSSKGNSSREPSVPTIPSDLYCYDSGNRAEVARLISEGVPVDKIRIARSESNYDVLEEEVLVIHSKN